MSSLTLHPITLGPITKGGYVIAYDGTVPPGATLLLGVPDVQSAMDVTRQNPKDLLTPANLPLFLSLIGKHRTWWGTKGRCRLFVTRGGATLAQSNEQAFDCPVRPYVGPLRPELGRGDAGPALRYTGTPPKYPDGRMFHVPAIDGCHYFAFGNRFETSNAMRGFNCITYAGAVFGVDARASSKPMSAYGTQLANHCGCIPCDVENKDLDEVRAFFARHPRGTFLMWSEHHTILVVNGIVHEFRELRRGYNTEPIAQWAHHDKRWWVRRAPKQF
jgi:hypothetical protein